MNDEQRFDRIDAELKRITSEHESLLKHGVLRAEWEGELALLKEYVDARLAGTPPAIEAPPKSIEGEALGRAELQETQILLADAIDLLLHAVRSGNIPVERAAALKLRAEKLAGRTVA